MKILQLVTKRQYRGAEVFAAQLSSELIKLGHEIIFAGLYKNHKDDLFVEEADNLDLADSKKGSLSLSLVKNLVKLIRIHRPDIIQCNGSDTLKYMFVASFLTPDVPIVYRNISIISEWIRTRPKKILYKNVFNRIDHVSSVGEEAVTDFINIFDYPPSKISVIRRGIPIREIKDSKVHDQYKKELGIEEGDKIVVHIGNFSAEKNHDFLLDVFSDIKKEDPKVKLICVGTGVLFEEMREKVKTKNLEKTVHLLGFRKDIPEILSVSDCFALCSKVEGVPGVILEAATQRKPSVSTNVGGVSEVLLDRETGYLVDNFDKKDFKDKLLKILNDEKLRSRLGENAFQLVSSEFNPAKNAVEFEDLYEQIRKRQKN